MFRSVKEFTSTAKPKPSTAERALIAACQTGEACTINGGTLPPEGNTDTSIQVRASLLRLLILGGTPDCGLHESGVILIGAHITETLDLRFATGRGQLALEACRFDEELRLEQAQLDMLSLNDSHFPGLFAQGAKVAGDAFLRRVTATASIDLAGAQISGQLEFNGASLEGAGSTALNAQGARITGSVFLSATEIAGKVLPFTAKGTVDVNSAEIGGQLACVGASLDGAGSTALNAQGARITGSMFLSTTEIAGKVLPFTAKGTVAVNRAEIGGQLNCEGASLDGAGGRALHAQDMRVDGGLFFRNVKAVKGKVDLTSAHVSDLVDDLPSWQLCQDGLLLDGLTYDRITADRKARIFVGRKAWLAKGARLNDDFFPQPYTQLAKVFRAAGDMGEARKVLFERDRLLFAEAYHADKRALDTALKGSQSARGDAGWIWLRLQGRRVWASLSRRIVGFGHRPELALFWALGMAMAGMLAYFIAYRAGLMVPNSDVIMVSKEWLQAVAENRAAPNDLWNGDSVGASAHYETFFALIYAFDVFLPIVDLGQESAWAATTTTSWGWCLRVATFAYQISGWVITSLGIAAVTGFIQRGGPD